MELFLHRNGKVRRISQIGLITAVCAGAILVFCGMLSVGKLVDKSEPMTSSAQESIVSAQQTDAQRLQQLLVTTDAQMSVLAARLGQLQGKLTRLESVGQQVGELVGFDPQVLGFDQPVPLGGAIDDETQPQLPELLQELRAYGARLEDRRVRFELLDQAVLSHLTHTQRLPTGKPTRSGWLSSAYGYRTHPLSGRRQFHRGVDLAGDSGDVVEVVASGVVTWAGYRDGYGNLLEVDHRNGYLTRYGHNEDHLVAVGELVRQGQQIATMGSTGRSTGPHVHFEVLKDGKHINPQKFLKARRFAYLNN